jgi:GIY-YIG catalytic domain
MFNHVTSVSRSKAHTDEQWIKEISAFIHASYRSRRPIFIDYLFDPDTGEIVPQRLYRYHVHDDYLTRDRDDFEFGFDFITRAAHITKPRTYGVYIIELDGNKNHLYVGQTWYEPSERLAQHNTGFAAFHAARPFKRGARGSLRPDLYSHLPRFRSQSDAESLEAQVARELSRQGFRVEGGH